MTAPRYTSHNVAPAKSDKFPDIRCRILFPEDNTLSSQENRHTGPWNVRYRGSVGGEVES